MNGTEVEDLVDRVQPRQASNLLLWAIAAFVVLFAICASVVKLDRTVHTPGRVIPSSRLQIVSNLEGGIVSAILVHPGDIVKAGQPLVRLDQTAAGAELESSEATLASLVVKAARLEAEVAGRPPSYPMPADTASAEQVAIERSLHAARMSDLASLSSAASAREAQARRGVVEAETIYDAKVAVRDAAQHQLAMMRPLVQRGIEPQLTLVQLESAATSAVSDAAQARAAIARAQAAVAEAHAAKAQVTDGWRAQAGADLTAVQAEIATRRKIVPMLADKVRRAVVTAPVAGLVNRVLVTTLSASVAPGSPIAEVVPSGDTLSIEATLSPRDISSVHVGQRARVDVTAYEAAVYGSMEGRVVTLSPDATVDDKTGKSYFTARIDVAADRFRDGSGRSLRIGAGMTADVSLLGDRRSILAYIFTPFIRLKDRAFRD